MFCQHSWLSVSLSVGTTGTGWHHRWGTCMLFRFISFWIQDVDVGVVTCHQLPALYAKAHDSKLRLVALLLFSGENLPAQTVFAAWRSKPCISQDFLEMAHSHLFFIKNKQQNVFKNGIWNWQNDVWELNCLLLTTATGVSADFFTEYLYPTSVSFDTIDHDRMEPNSILTDKVISILQNSDDLGIQ